MKSLFLTCAVLCAVLCLPAAASTFYASPSGTANGDGTYDDPWDLATALAAEAIVQPGDTVFLRAGTYGSGGSTSFSCTLDGTSGSPIYVRAYPGERATVDGEISAVSGSSYVIFRDLESTNSETDRECAPTDRLGGFTLNGSGNSVVNCIIHDTGHPGIGFWENCSTAAINGCIIWGTGVYDTEDMGTPESPMPRGSAIYTQNETGVRSIKDVVSFRNFTYGVKPYATTSYVNGYHIEGCTVFDNLWGNIHPLCESSSHHITDLQIKDNCTTKGLGIYVGKGGKIIDDCEITGNYAMMMSLHGIDDLTVTGNTIFGPNDTTTDLVKYNPLASPTSETWDNNTYFSRKSTPFLTDGVAWFTFSSWKSYYGFDTNSTLTAAMPSTNYVSVRQNDYDPNRTLITIYNWEEDEDVSIDVSGILSSGDTYEVRDAQNYYGTAVLSGTYTSGTLDIPMDQTSVAQPIGDTPTVSTAAWSTFCGHFTASAPTFGVFILIRDEPTLVIADATDRDAAEFLEDTGEFTIRRTGSTTSALTVNYTVSGTATSGGPYTVGPGYIGGEAGVTHYTGDYEALSGTATIPAGESSVTITVQPYDDILDESDETVTITLSTGTGYVIHDSASSATVTIENRVPLTDFVILQAEDAALSMHSAGVGWNLISDSAAHGGQAIQGDVSLGYSNNNGIAEIDVTFNAAGTYQLYYRCRTEDLDGNQALGDNDSFRLSVGTGATVFSTPSNLANVVRNTAYAWKRAGATSAAFVYTVETGEVGVPQTLTIETYDAGVTIDAIVFTTDAACPATTLDNVCEQTIQHPRKILFAANFDLDVKDAEEEGWNVIEDEDAYAGYALQADDSINYSNDNGEATTDVTFEVADTYELYYRCRTEDVDSDNHLGNNDSVKFTRGDGEDVFSSSTGRQAATIRYTTYAWRRASSVSSPDPGSWFQYEVESGDVGTPQTFLMETYDMGVVIDAIVLSPELLTSRQLDAMVQEVTD